MVMARKRRAPYAGALAQPIYVDQDAPGYHRYPDVTAALKRCCRREQRKRCCCCSNTTRSIRATSKAGKNWRFSLAFEHVPGLQLAFRPKPGRKPTWKTGLGDELVRAVEDVKSRTGKRTEDAIAKLKGESGGTWGRYTVENLGARYREAKRHQEQFRKAVEAARELRARGRNTGRVVGLVAGRRKLAHAQKRRDGNSAARISGGRDVLCGWASVVCYATTTTNMRRRNARSCFDAQRLL